MDIAKYIGLFLLKNEYCYLPGIGSLTVVKKAAAYNKETQQMNPPEYSVLFQQASGSIDDSFANFIANNERISIAHASNYLKDFCARAKNDLKEGKEIMVPSIGKFYTDEHQKIQFTPDPHLQIQGKTIPFFKNSPVVEKQREEALTNIIERTEFKEPKADEAIVMQPPQVNWPKIIILILVVLAIVAALVYFIIHWTTQNNNVPHASEQPEQQEAPAHPATAAPENLPPAPDAAASQAATPENAGFYKVSLNQYPTIEAARHRAAQLNSYGNTVEVWTKDSVTFSVIVRIPAAQKQEEAVDSLKRLFNPRGKVMVVE